MPPRGRKRLGAGVSSGRELGNVPSPVRRSRAPQPNRQPPEAWASAPKRRRSTSETPPLGSTVGISHQERNLRKEDNWAKERPNLVRRYITGFQRLSDWEKSLRDTVLQHYQDRVDSVQATFQNAPLCGCPAGSLLPLGDNKQRVLHSDRCVGVLNVQTFSCSSCQQQVAVEPEDVGCFRSTPRNPVVWFDQVMLERARFLATEQGVSGDGVLQSLWLSQLAKT